MESLTGRLGHIVDTSLWLLYRMSHMYTSITYALGESKAHLTNTRKDFRAMLKLAKGRWVKAGTYSIGERAKKIPNTPSKE